MMIKIDAKDEIIDRQVKAIMDAEVQKSLFKKLLAYNRPKINILFGMLASVI